LFSEGKNKKKIFEAYPKLLSVTTSEEAMENVFDVGVKPYRAASPDNGHSAIDSV